MVLLKTWADWCETTGVGAAGKTRFAKTTFFKLIWWVVFLCGIVGTVLAVLHVFQAYFDYAVSTTVSLKFDSYVDFPSVTICNQNPVDCSRLKTLVENCTDVDNYDNCPLQNQTNQEGFSDSIEVVANMTIDLYELACVQDSDVYTDIINQTTDGDSQQGSNSQESSKRRKRATSQTSMGDMLQSESTDNFLMSQFMFFHSYNRQLFGHAFDNLIRECSFKGRDCKNSTKFATINVPSYGNCYIFNSVLLDDEDEEIRVASLTGPKFGLKLVLNTEQANYMKNSLSKEAGVRISIHNTSQIPLMDEHGFDVEPGTSTTFALRKLNITRLASPYTSKCYSGWDTNTNYTKYVPPKIGWGYTLPLCQRLCLLSTFIEACNCVHPSFLDDDGNRYAPGPCRLNVGEANYDCVNSIYDDLDTGNRNCNCSVECEEDDHEVAVSTAAFPSQVYESYAQTSYGYPDESDMTNNMLMVRVYFSTLNIKHITEKAVYSSLYSSEFLSSLGGALSLYLGITLAMLVEIFEFGTDLLYNYSKNKNKSINKM